MGNEIVVTPLQPMQSIQSSAGFQPPSSAQLLPVDLNSDVPPILQQLGFVPTGQTRMRLFITNEGPPGSGKTRFIETCPGPIGVVDFDCGTEGVLDRDLKGRTITRLRFESPEFDEVGAKTLSMNEWESAKREYERLKYVCSAIIRSGQVRTLGFETGGAAYALAQAARFGRLAMVGEVPAQVWTAMQQEFEKIFLEAYDHGLNVVVTHRQGTKYKGMAGEREMKGYKQMQFLSQVHLVHQKREVRVPAPTPQNPAATKAQAELSIKIGKCRPRLSLDGAELPIVLLGEDPATGKMQSIGGSFVDVAMAVFPGSRPENWG